MISAFAVIRNEEQYLQRMFDNVKDYVDEIIIIDQESEDNSIDICEKNDAKVYKEFCVGYSEPHYEKSKSLCSNEWILMLGPDEVLRKDTLEKIREIGSKPVTQDECHAFRRVEYTDGIVQEVSHPNYQLRMSPKKYATFSDLIHTSFLNHTNIIHHDLFIDHLPSGDRRKCNEERYDNVYKMLVLRYKYSKDPWIKAWMKDYTKQIERYSKGDPWIMR